MAAKEAVLRRLFPSAARFLRRPSRPSTGGRSLHQNRLVVPSEGLALPTGDRLLDRLRSLSPSRLHLESLVSPEDARKVLRASRVAAARERLKALPDESLSYGEFVRICGGEAADGVGISKALDDAGDVIVLGDIVLLRPDQVARAIQGMILNSTKGKVRSREEEEELRMMEQEKAKIDAKADTGVRKELWTGLGFLAVQTLGFMRLTFWELSWDVMEPVCFYVTSLYFMLGYAFFLRTSKDPSFEGFYQTRFASKQQRLLDSSGFDLRRFDELNRLVHGHRKRSTATSSYCECGHPNHSTTPPLIETRSA